MLLFVLICDHDDSCRVAKRSIEYPPTIHLFCVFLLLFAKPSTRGISYSVAKLVTGNEAQIKHPMPEYQSSKSALRKQSNTKCTK